MSGHSKWSQIKHKKALTDSKRGQLFSKMVREIMMAVRFGGSAPESNIRLRSALERARAAGLPKDNIERAVQRAGGEENASLLQEFLCEAITPSGIGILIEGITDNRNRTFAELKHLLAQHKARLADPGSILWNFEKIGAIQILAEENPQKNREEIEFIILGSDAKDFRDSENVWTVETVFEETEKVRQKLEKAGVKVKEIGHDFKPKSTLSVPAVMHETLENLQEALSDHDDVQEIYTNLIPSDS